MGTGGRREDGETMIDMDRPPSGIYRVTGFVWASLAETTKRVYSTFGSQIVAVCG